MKQFRWKEGKVDPAIEHFQLRWVPDDADRNGSRPLALVGRASDWEFLVEFLASSEQGSSERFGAMRRDLDYYLVEKGERNPWGYAQYHCTTAANLYSKVHWTFSEGESRTFEVIGPFPVSRDHLALFRSGVLPRAWARAYPMLFRPGDVSLALAQPRNHYFEWVAAIMLYHTHGLLSLQKYEFPETDRVKIIAFFWDRGGTVKAGTAPTPSASLARRSRRG